MDIFKNWSEIVTGILGLLGVFLVLKTKKIDFDIKKKEDERLEQEKIKEEKRSKDLDLKLDVRIKTISEKLEGLNQYIIDIDKTNKENTEFQNATLKNIENTLTKHVDEEYFRKDIQNAIQITTNQIITFSKNNFPKDDPSFVLLLWNWSNKIERYATNYYELKVLNPNKKEFKSMLNEHMEMLINDFYSDVDYSIHDYVMKGAKRLTLSKLMKEGNIHQRSYLLADKLADNGFKTKDELIDTIKSYIIDFSQLFITTCATWNQEKFLNKQAS